MRLYNRYFLDLRRLDKVLWASLNRSWRQFVSAPRGLLEKVPELTHISTSRADFSVFIFASILGVFEGVEFGCAYHQGQGASGQPLESAFPSA